ncbi:hypothetical protein ACLB2K_072896 [Fragaria x ananassa]
MQSSTNGSSRSNHKSSTHGKTVLLSPSSLSNGGSNNFKYSALITEYIPKYGGKSSLKALSPICSRIRKGPYTTRLPTDTVSSDTNLIRITQVYLPVSLLSKQILSLFHSGRINYALRSKHDKDGRTEEVNVKSCLGAENYGGHFQSSSDDSRRVNGQIVTDSDEKCDGNESFVYVALDGNTLTLSTEPSLLNSPAHVNFSMSVGGDKSQMIEESCNCKLGTSLGTYKLVSDALKYGGGRKEHRQNVRSKRLGCTYIENQVSPLVSYVTPQAGCTKLRYYIEGSRKSTQCVLHLCFSVFDKEVRDKGSGHPRLTDAIFALNTNFARNKRLLWESMSNLISAIGNSVTMVSNLLLAMILKALGPCQDHTSDDDSVLGRFSLMNHQSPYGFTNDSCHVRINDKTKLSRLAYHLKKQEKSSLLAATDDYISTATYQLAVLGEQVSMITFGDTKLDCKWFGFQFSKRRFLYSIAAIGMKIHLLMLIAGYGAIGVVLAISLTSELAEKSQCVKTLILKVKLEDKFLLKGEELL